MAHLQETFRVKETAKYYAVGKDSICTE